jgi:hypothetical protein
MTEVTGKQPPIAACPYKYTLLLKLNYPQSSGVLDNNWPKVDLVVPVCVCHRFEVLSPLLSLWFTYILYHTYGGPLLGTKTKPGIHSFCTRTYVNHQNIFRIS